MAHSWRLKREIIGNIKAAKLTEEPHTGGSSASIWKEISEER